MHFDVTKMDKLSEKEQKDLKKSSTQRLIAMLVNAGQEETKIPLERADLLKMVAELQVSGVIEKISGATGGIPTRAEAQWKEEMALRRAEFDAREADRVSREREKKADDETLVNRTKKYSDAIKNTFPVLPFDSAELPIYLDNVDHLFDMYEVPADLRSKLLLPQLTGKIKSVVSKMSLDELNDYELIKRNILKEFSITSRELHSRFTQATKRRDETFCVFRGRLELLLNHYLRSRQVTDLDKLVDLLIADKLKDCLSDDILKYVLSLEGSDFHDSHKVAANADVFTANYFADGTYKGSHVTNLPLYGRGRGGKRFYKQRFDSNPRGLVADVRTENLQEETLVKSVNAAATNLVSKISSDKQPVKTVKRTCLCCKSEGHVVANCPHRKPGVYYKNPWSTSTSQTVKANKQVNSAEIPESNVVVSNTESSVQGNACGIVNNAVLNTHVNTSKHCDIVILLCHH